MKKNLKIGLVTAILLAVIGVSTAVYGASLQTVNANSNAGQSSNSSSTKSFPTPYPPSGYDASKELAILKKFLKHVTAVSVNGTVVGLVNGTLILNTNGGNVRIFLPELWSVDTELMGRAQLFNNTFSGREQNVTVKALKSIIFEGSNFSINVMFGYEIINEQGIHAFAVLPFNIETKTEPES